ncbi:MAG: ZIP family metal transporter [Gaiellaceae bacterium]
MLEAALWGLFTAGSLLLGAGVALVVRPGHRAVGLTIGFGAGALIAAVAYELVLEGFETSNRGAAAGFIAGALAFYVGDFVIDRQGGHGRKKMTAESGLAGSASAIVLGTVLDGITESFVLGASLRAEGVVPVAVVVGVFVSNVPESLSATTGLREAEWRRGRLLGMWSAVVAVSVVAAALGWWALDAMPAAEGAFALGFAAGALLVMLADTLMPEAFELGGREAGLLTALGFAVGFALS